MAGLAGSTTPTNRGWVTADQRSRGGIAGVGARPRRGTVSITRPVMARTSSASPQWTRHGSTAGWGNHSAMAPAATGPTANPAPVANTARLAPRSGPAAADSCGGHAPATDTTTPEATPVASRLAYTTDSASVAAARAALAAADSARARRTTRRRPNRSAARHPSNSAG